MLEVYLVNAATFTQRPHHNTATANRVWALYNLIKFSWIEIELLNDPPEQNCGGLSHPPAHKRELKERARSKPDDINAWILSL